VNNLKHISLFKGCESAFFDELETQGQSLTCPKGRILFISGEQADRFYYIKSGWVKLFRETLDGTQAVVDILPAGHVFGETSIFSNNNYPYSAEVVESAEVIALPTLVLKTEVENNNKLALNMLNHMARYRAQQDKEIEHLSIQNASQRIGCFLLSLAKQDSVGATTIRLPYDKTLVASRLGMQPETFSRALAKLRDKTGIQVNGATINVDNLKQLSSYSCAACSSEFPCKNLKA
tara:strand:- start:73344 stop:74048 length:705 start_codon:yes stop_codon:yes gene_type:complete